MKKQIFVFAVLAPVIFTSGCAGTAKICHGKTRKSISQKSVASEASFIVGEKFTYLAAWKGIPVGSATVTLEELTIVNGFEVYKIVVRAQTNKFLSRIFKVDDVFTSYMDKDKLVSRRYEGLIREGNYRKNLIVNYDDKKNLAVYRNLTDGSTKTCLTLENVRDPICAAYFFRTIPLKTGDQVQMAVNLCENNYELIGNIMKTADVDLAGLGRFNAFLVEPYIKLKGKLQKRATARGYISADKKRLGLFMVLRVLEIPWIGEVTATLKKVEYVNKDEKQKNYE